MSIFYQNLVKSVALRTIQIVGGNAAARDAAYSAASIQAYLDGIQLPYSALKQDCLAVESELAVMVGNSNDPAWRSHLKAHTANLLDKAEIPSVDSNGFHFVGGFDGVFDADDGTILTEKDKETVQRRITNPNGFFTIPGQHYCFEGTIIRHTQASPGVYLRGCSWDYATQSALFDLPPITPANKTFAAAGTSTSTETLTVTGHGYLTGYKISLTLGAGGTLPAPLAVGTYYFVIVVDANTIKLATTYFNALAGTAINLTAVGVLTNNTIVFPLTGGGASPLPAEMENIWRDKMLAGSAENKWLMELAQHYQGLANQREQSFTGGKAQEQRIPAMPITTARTDTIKD